MLESENSEFLKQKEKLLHATLTTYDNGTCTILHVFPDILGVIIVFDMVRLEPLSPGLW